MRDPSQEVALFDLRPRLGGNAMGEVWRGVPYSLGSAYFMVPDEGSMEESLYRELGIFNECRIDSGDGFVVEYGDELLSELCHGCSLDEQMAYERYRKAVDFHANEAYPDIPLDPASIDVALGLDSQTFEANIALRTKGPLPPIVKSAIQAYCYSSFGVGAEILNAAAGWNFIAAEEFGRIVMPGGNAGLARTLWSVIHSKAQQRARGGSGSRRSFPTARLEARVVKVELEPGSTGARIQWIDRQGQMHLTRANHAIIACSKFIARHIMPALAQYDKRKFDATFEVPTTAYLVANVLLNRPVDANFYDLFSVHDSAFPQEGAAFESDRRITDVLAGSYTNGPRADADVLTLYWPLPWHTARFTVVNDDDWRNYAEIGAPQIQRLLTFLGVPTTNVRQVRIARWGHAMPFMAPGFLVAGHGQALQRSIDGRIHFVNQDNWALPAWETCLADANAAVNEILS
ncbi:MAG: NAD(P)/FAD-dependent oxidoreductase [Planctomycetota bacterium]|nr:NAD(P)/FAD-dependent oxidoreductase [Planctomycetota bacterium]